MGFHQYNVYRADRNINISNFTREGGVLIAVSKKLFSRLLHISINNLEQIFILVNIGNKCIIVGAVYILIRVNKLLFLDHFTTVENVLLEFPDLNIILLGDYNLPSVLFNDSDSFFNEQIFNLNLSQFNHIKNINGTNLDKLISNYNKILIKENMNSIA
jgi:hypothetical protein